MKKPTIAVDVDEVLSPLHELVILHHNLTYGTMLTPYDASGKYYLHEFTGDQEAEAIAKLDSYFQTDKSYQDGPINGSLAALKRLSQNYKLVIVTSRQDKFAAHTRQWLETHFPKLFAEVHFTAYVTNQGVKVQKSVICQQLGAEWLIDDNVGYVSECAAAGIHGILFGDYPWNRAKTLADNVTRCKDWKAVLEYFDAQK